MADWLVGIDKLPIFRDGQPLSASALSRLGAAHRYLNGRYERVIPAIPYVNWGNDCYIVHLHRYLHYNLYQFQGDPPRVFQLLIDDHAALELSLSDDAPRGGTVDLEGNNLDGDPLNLTVGKAYRLKWQLISGSTSWWSGVYGRELYETDTTSSAPTLPYSSQSFSDGQVLTATKLNALSSNTNYLLGSGGMGHMAGLTYVSGGIQANGTTSFWYRMRHNHQYLTVYAQLVTGSTNATLDFWINVNGSTLYADHQVKNGFATFTYKRFIDLSSSGISVGDWYTIEVKAYKSSYDSVLFEVFFVGETTEDDFPAW